MVLTKKQEEGLKLAVTRFKNQEPYTCIAGYAGSGKSTLVKFIVSALNFDPQEVAYVAYTGKAAQVLSQKGCPNATTAHKLLYKAILKSDGSYIFIPKETLDDDFKLLVVDEISMLPLKMWLQLLSYGIHILACGDPEQLPCLIPSEDNHVLDTPHIFLDEIMRQAQESEIVRLSMWIREGKSLKSFDSSNEEVIIFSPSDVHLGMYHWADQILCAKNDTRNILNKQMRDSLGREETPAIGDKIICCRNEWDTISTDKDRVPLVNGTIGYIDECFLKTYYIPSYISQERLPVCKTSFTDETGHTFSNINIDYKAIISGKKFLTPKQEFQMIKNKKCINPPTEFAYGYAITVWKAQGSEWNNVLGFEEKFPFDRDEHRRFLYTMITRAKRKLVIIAKN